MAGHTATQSHRRSSESGWERKTSGDNDGNTYENLPDWYHEFKGEVFELEALKKNAMHLLDEKDGAETKEEEGHPSCDGAAEHEGLLDCVAHSANGVASSKTFEALIVLTILVSAVTIGMEANFTAMGHLSPTMRAAVNSCENMTLVIFSVEIIIRILSKGRDPLSFFLDHRGLRPARSRLKAFAASVHTLVSSRSHVSVSPLTQFASASSSSRLDLLAAQLNSNLKNSAKNMVRRLCGWNCFDFTIVLLSLAALFDTAGNFSMSFSALRLVRVLKLIGKFQELQVILKGFSEGLSAVGSIMLMMVLVMFMFAVVGKQMLGKNDPVKFGTVPVAMLTLFQVATLASWGAVYQTAYFGCDAYDAGLLSWPQSGRYQLVHTNDTSRVWPPKFSTSGYGSFYEFECVSPSSSPYFSRIYFFTYTLCAAFFILSLFVSVITVGMLDAVSAIDEHQREQAAAKATRIHITPSSTQDEIREAHRQTENELSDPDTVLGNLVAEAIEIIGVVQADGTGVPVAVRRASRKSRMRRLSVVVVGAQQHVTSEYSPQRMRLARKCDLLRNADVFQIIIVLAILASAVAALLEADEMCDPSTLDHLNSALLAIFTVEIAIKLVAEDTGGICDTARNFMSGGWNCFDLVVVAISYIGLIVDGFPALSGGAKDEVVRNVRLMRLLRMFKFAEAVPALRTIVIALLYSFRYAAFVVVLITIINYIFAVGGIILFHENDPQHWHSLGAALMTVWQVETLDEWDTLMYTNMFGCNRYGYTDLSGHSTTGKDCIEPFARGWQAAGYFVMLVIFGAMLMPTVLIGVIQVAFDTASKNIQAEKELSNGIKEVCSQMNVWAQGCDNSTIQELVALRGYWVTGDFLAGLRELYEELSIRTAHAGVGKEQAFPTLCYLTEHCFASRISRRHTEMLFALVAAHGDQVNFAEFAWLVMSLKRAAYMSDDPNVSTVKDSADATRCATHTTMEGATRVNVSHVSTFRAIQWDGDHELPSNGEPPTELITDPAGEPPTKLTASPAMPPRIPTASV